LDAAKRHYAMTYALLPIEIQNIVPSTIWEGELNHDDYWKSRIWILKKIII
jgi:hypothetical protein